MATHQVSARGQPAAWSLERVATFPQMRGLAWCDNRLFASRGYHLLRAEIGSGNVEWKLAGRYRPAWWRKLSSSTSLGHRLFRDGFHALAALASGHIVAAVPGAIVRLAPGHREFIVCHRVTRGTRPLHIAATPEGHLFWGEYFDNANRDEVHVYASSDRGVTWNVAYTFARGAIRHVHNIVYDAWENCLWILTGDNGTECRILRATCDLSTVEVVLSGNQQARSVALVPTADGLYFSSDTPLEANHVYCLDRRMNLAAVATLDSSSIYGCRVGESIFFSTMVEPSQVNRTRAVGLYGSSDGCNWQRTLSWKKDRWPMGLFQYGNAFLPDGRNATNLLALTTVAVTPGDMETSLWRVKT